MKDLTTDLASELNLETEGNGPTLYENESNHACKEKMHLGLGLSISHPNLYKKEILENKKIKPLLRPFDETKTDLLLDDELRRIQQSKFPIIILRQLKVSDVDLEYIKRNYVQKESSRRKRNYSFYKERPYACGRCTYRCRTKFSLQSHLRSHVGSKGKYFKCTLCPFSTSSEHILPRHMGNHCNRWPFKCRFCSFSCKSSSAIWSHHNLHLATEQECYGVVEKPFQCRICQLGFTKKSLLEEHVNISHRNKFKCKRCRYTTTKESLLQNHLTLMHSHAFKCALCTYRTLIEKKLKKHLKEVHHCENSPVKKIRREIKLDRKSEGDKVKNSENLTSFKCQHCSYYSDTKFSLKIHLKNSHPGKTKLNKCLFCTYRSTVKSLLQKHMMKCHSISFL